MERIKLKVPFSEKDKAKQLGARWDPVIKTWYIPEDIDPEPFVQWRSTYTEEKFINFFSDSFYIASALRSCWKCQKITNVYAFFLPSGCKFIWDVTDDGKIIWETGDELHFLSYITFLSQDALKEIKSITKNYYPDTSSIIPIPYWMNHCEHCGAKLGDNHTFLEVGSPFWFESNNEESGIKFKEIKKHIEGYADVKLSVSI